MKEVTVVENPRGRGFWFGLLSGLVAMFVVAIILWFMGIIDIFPQDEQNNTANTTNVTNLANEPENVPANNLTNETSLENVTKEVEELEAEELSENPFFVDAVLAKNIDTDINPVEETSEFSTNDKRVYVIVTLDKSVPAGTNVGVEWYKDGKLSSDFDTDVSKGQTLAYFYFPPSGAGEYSVKILIDGVAVEELKFSVK